MSLDGYLNTLNSYQTIDSKTYEDIDNKILVMLDTYL